MDHILTAKVDNVRLVDPFGKNKYVNGTLHLTTTHLIFVDPQGAKEAWILHSHIASIDRLPLMTVGSPMKVRCKNFRSITFVIAKERVCSDVYTSLNRLCAKASIKELYAFDYKPINDNQPQSSGWQLYDAVREFERMEIPLNLWVRTKLNENYKLCPTYPSVLYVPASATDGILRGSAQFRSKGRLPALSYYHKDTKAAIIRCAQPLSGFNARCLEDEQLLQDIIKSNPAVPDLFIIDTRPKINAMANRAAGKGYENVDNYENVKFHFIGIENIHVMRQSLQKLVEVCENKQLSQSAFLNGLDSSGYLRHIKSILDTSSFISKAVHINKSNVLVHCSDGWDRTAQTCSLAGILLNPYYRTIHGLQVLIEKEWLSFGHKFVHRCGLLSGDPKESSPIFTQFLDCIWQLTQQYPTAFEFNERFLIELNHHVYSCQFGTFLGNCERERKDARSNIIQNGFQLDANDNFIKILLEVIVQEPLSEQTYSLWGYMWQHISEYINPFFKDGCHSVLQPQTSLQQIRFWIGLYNRYDNQIQKRESVLDELVSVNDHNDSLKDHVRLLSKRIEILKLLKESKEIKLSTNNPSTNDKRESLTHPPIDATDEAVANGKAIETEDSSQNNTDSSVVRSLEERLARLGLTEDDVLRDLPAFAIDWKPVRDVHQCRCGSPIDFISRKYHCWNCGEVFCLRCINQQCSLPVHYSENKVPVCKPCYKALK